MGLLQKNPKAEKLKGSYVGKMGPEKLEKTIQEHEEKIKLSSKENGLSQLSVDFVITVTAKQSSFNFHAFNVISRNSYDATEKP